MKVKKVNRYYCEYCKKAGCNAYWMRRHEDRCTMNPNRHCGYCDMIDDGETDLQELIDLLPNPKGYIRYMEGLGEYFDSTLLGNDANHALKKIRQIANCPACIMAAIRQRGIPVPIVSDFDFKKECQEIWDSINEENISRELY